MADNAAEEVKAPVQIATSGKPVGSPFPFPTYTENREEGNGNENNNGGVNKEAAASPDAKTGENSNDNKDDNGKVEVSTGNSSTESKAKETTSTETTEDQVRLWLKSQGIEFETVDSLKEKVTAKPPTKELTPEEKAKVEKDKEHRVLSEFLAEKDATVEKFAALKQVIAADKKILGMEKEVTSLVAEGFTPEEARELAKERYFQFTDEEIEAIEDAAEKARSIKLRDAGSKKLERKGDYLQKGTKEYINILEQKIADRDADTALVEQHASNVEAAIKKYERKQTIEMGQVEDQKIDPIGFEVPEAAMTSAKEIIGDLPKLKKQLLTESGHVNLEFLLPHIIKSLAFDSVAKTGYLEGQDRSVKQFKAKFGANIPTLGANQNGNNGKGKIVTAGKPTVGRPEYKNN